MIAARPRENAGIPAEKYARRLVPGLAEAPEGAPFLFTRNYDPGALQSGDESLVLTDDPPFGKKAVVVVLKGGSAYCLKGSQLKNSLFNPAGAPSAGDLEIVGP